MGGVKTFVQLTKTHALARRLWNKACDWDKIPPESRFVAFSRNNPYAEMNNRAMIVYFSIRERLVA